MVLKNRIENGPVSSLHVAELARQAGVTSAAVRYYSRIGLLHPGRAPDNGYRCFTSADLDRVFFIRRAQALGLTIGDIKTILESVDHGEVPCQQVRRLVEQRLIDVQRSLLELRETEKRILATLENWKTQRYEAPADGELCPLIERLDIPEKGAKRSVH